MKLWLDDERDPEQDLIQTKFGSESGMLWVTTAEEAMEWIVCGGVDFISFDNDLGTPHAEGMDLASWIEEMAFFGTIPKMEWRVHTANPVAEKSITQAMRNADKFWKTKGKD
jgi:hypothetical protein